jgi:RNA polymerase sigma-70 factor (ECF subfamily)
MSEDLQVIRRVLGGDIEAFRLLVERYQAPLFCLIRNLVPDASDCEDIAQEVFLSAYRHLAAFDPGRATFSTWLWTIARNLSLNAVKKKRPLPLGELPEALDARTPETELCEQELSRQLDAALAALPFEQRTAFVLSEIQGLSYEEIAHIEGINLGTVKSRISRARDKLRCCLRRTAEQR